MTSLPGFVHSEEGIQKASLIGLINCLSVKSDETVDVIGEMRFDALVVTGVGILFGDCLKFQKHYHFQAR